MRILVTGATGFIGRHLVRKLNADGHTITALVRPTSDLSVLAPAGSHIRCITACADPEALAESIAGAAPDVVVHLATLFIAEHKPGDVQPLLRSNLEFPAIVVEAMALAGVTKLVNVSTAWQHYLGEVYNPASLYAATKQAFLDILRLYVETRGFAVIDLTVNDSYGPDDTRPKLFAALAKAASGPDPVDFSPGEQRIDLVYVEDVVDAFLIAIERLNTRGVAPGLERFAVRGEAPIRLRDLASLFAEVTGLAPNITWGGRPYRAREFMDPPAVEQALPGWRAKVPIREGITRTISKNV